MSNQELLSELQKKRKENEAIDNEIYYLRLALFNLSANEKKLGSREIKISAEAAETINKLRKKLEELKKAANDTSNKIINIEQQLIDDPKNRIESMKDEITSNENILKKLKIQREKNLNDRKKLKEIDDEIKKSEEANRELSKNIRLQEEKSRKWESERQPLIQEKENLNEKKKRNEHEQEGLQKELSDLNTGNENELENLRNKKVELERKLKSKLTEKERASNIFTELVGRYFGERNLEELTSEKDDKIPILLFPVKLETKFRETAEGKKELCVRVYPDEIEIVTHEEELTQNEYDNGITYWKAIFNAKDVEQEKHDAWLNMINRFGAPRSAWIAIRTRPENFNESDELASADEFIFPVLENIKPSSWTRSPRTKIMPDRFVIIAIKDNTIIHQVIGNQIPEPLITGPDPLDPDNSFDTETDVTDIKLGEEFDWTVDFEKAIGIGLGFKISLTEPFVSEGFDKLFALGLRWSSDETESKEKTEELINDHHYSPGGFSLLKQGTATNNTDDESSSFSSNDTFSSLSYFIETGDPLFTKKTSVLEITDGQILADFLGIDYSPLQNISNSDNKDFAEAVAMNRALYPATLGYYLDTLMESVFNDEEREKIRDYFVNNVTGRGPVSAIRVGKQPYGILPTSNFSKWKWNREIEGSNFGFLNKMHEILSNFYGRWKSFIPSLSHVGQNGNPSEILLNILGLNPDSVNFFQRTGYSVDYLKNLSNFKMGGKDFGEIIKNWFATFNMLTFLGSLGYQSTDASGNPKKIPHILQLIYQHYHTRLDNKNIIDTNPLSESRTIKSYTSAENGPNYIDWLSQAKTVEELEKQNFGEGVTAPNALLYLMLRHSLLNQLHDTTGKIYIKNNIDLIRYKRPQDFYNIQSNTDPTKWEMMKAKANVIMPQTADNELSIGDFILSRVEFNSNEAELENLKEVKEALNVLSKMPTAKLERCFVEHLDTLTYRLDAWLNAMMTFRLRKNRNIISRSDSSETKRGIYVGAYGWLENVRPSQGKKIISEQELPVELRKNGTGLIFDDPANAGYTHAPSINHAHAAALLRSAYLTHANSQDRDIMSVNLSSSRIRSGMSLIEGIRNGQSIELLLGYQFERGLHDRTSENPLLKLNQYIYDFRDKFPIKMQPIPQKGGDESEETIEINYITNGLDLAQTTAVFPFGITSLNNVSAEIRNSILLEIDKLKDSLDSVKDILVSESAYQLALGNFERAGAAIKSVSDMTAPAEIEVINSQRSNEISFTNRIGVQFESDLDLTLPINNSWNITPLSPRFHTEPGVNKWLAKVLGNPENIRCLVKDIDEINNIESPFIEIKLSELNIHPVDFIYMLGNELQAGATELEQRINYYYRKTKNITDSLTVKIEFGEIEPTADKSIKSFKEIFPLAMYLKKLITDGRHLHAEDFHIFSKDPYLNPDNKKGYNVIELHSRIEKIKVQMSDALQNLKDALQDYKNNPAILTFADSLRENLMTVSFFNLPEAIPFSKFGNNDSIRDLLIAQSEAIILKLEKSKTDAGDLITLAGQPDKSIDNKIQLLISAGKIMLGEVFNIMPLFNHNNPSDIANAYNDSDTVLLNYVRNTLGIKIPVEEWMEGLVRVRSKVDLFENIRMLSEAFDHGEINLDAIQLPYKANDSWLAMEYPEDIGDILHNTVSIVMNFPDGFNPNVSQSGILIDDWTEEILSKSEVTGVAINCNQPNAAPPQTILLAITPEEKGHWSWNELVEILDDTLTRAKMRAVEPDMIDQTNLATLLPAIVSEFSTYQSNISLDYTLNILNVNEAVKANFKVK